MQKKSFYSLLKEYESSLLEKHLKNHPFLIALEKGEVSSVTLKRLTVEYVQFYDHIFDFISPSLSWQFEPQVGKRLSNWFVKALANVSPEYLEKKVWELGTDNFELKFDSSMPANIAIKNQMLLLSLNHPYAFISCLEICFNSGWQINKVIESLMKNEKYNIYLEIFTKTSKYLSQINNCFSWVNNEYYLSKEDEFFIKKHLKLLVEKFEMLYNDLAENKEELQTLEIPKLLQSNRLELDHV